MTARSSFRRKIIYLLAIAGLLILLYWVGSPASSDSEQGPGSPGGKLARLRAEHQLNQAQLGEIDPTSETIKLATLGLRGVAANILWGKAHNYKKKKDWTNLSATVNQITKVQPNFISVWIFNAWNLSYNVSVEFDDVRERYRWVIKGVDFLREGIRYNDREPRLNWEIGWVLSNKIGRADERKQYRRLFELDDAFHEGRPVALRDNWLVGKEWFQRAEDLCDDLGVKMKGKGPLIYRSNAPMCQMNFADALEQDGSFGEEAELAWILAGQEWHEYGDKDIPTGADPIRLNEQEMFEENAQELIDQIDALAPDLRQEILDKKRAGLTAEQRLALDTPAEERSAEQQPLAVEAEKLLQVTYAEVAREIKRPNRKKAIELAKQVAENQRNARIVASYRQIVNFEYWRLRAEIEQTELARNARKLIHDGDRAFAEGDLSTTIRHYDDGLVAWRKVLDKHPGMLTDETFGYDMMEVIDRYRYILELDEEEFPKEFILQDIIDYHRVQR